MYIILFINILIGLYFSFFTKAAKAILFFHLQNIGLTSSGHNLALVTEPNDLQETFKLNLSRQIDATEPTIGSAKQTGLLVKCHFAARTRMHFRLSFINGADVLGMTKLSLKQSKQRMFKGTEVDLSLDSPSHCQRTSTSEKAVHPSAADAANENRFVSIAKAGNVSWYGAKDRYVLTEKNPITRLAGCRDLMLAELAFSQDYLKSNNIIYMQTNTKKIGSISRGSYCFRLHR